MMEGVGCPRLSLRAGPGSAPTEGFIPRHFGKFRLIVVGEHEGAEDILSPLSYVLDRGTWVRAYAPQRIVCGSQRGAAARRR